MAQSTIYNVDDSLTSQAPPSKVTRLLGWSELKNKNFPLLFYGIHGKDFREADSPSFFNPYVPPKTPLLHAEFRCSHEASTVAHLISRIMTEKGITPDEIGVISPYYKQVRPRSILNGCQS